MTSLLKNRACTLLSYCLIIMLASCDKMIEVPQSKNQIETSLVFSDTSSAKAALLNAYITLSNQVHPGMKYLGLYTDEYIYTTTDPGSLEFYQSKLNTDNAANGALWNGLYFVIYQCNDLIEQLEISSSIPVNSRYALTAEAKFLRAFSYFYLVNLYDNVPLLLSTNVSENSSAVQRSPDVIYSQIIQDLEDAKEGLNDKYQGPGKVRANKWAATAMLSRTYAFQSKWVLAEKEATEVIQSLKDPLPAPGNVFLANSTETILQLWTPNGFISDATSLIPANATRIPAYVLSDALYNQFQINDLRKTRWTGTNKNTTSGVTKSYFYPAKYKNRTSSTTQAEYVMVLRLSEQYLIRAEARAQRGNILGAVQDLNIVRGRAEASAIPDNIIPTACLKAISVERQMELFGEWAHRFLDLKRTAKLDEVLAPLKNNWIGESAKRLPIPRTETLYNPNLKQNYGYQK